jgi:hypothetical protein
MSFIRQDFLLSEEMGECASALSIFPHLFNSARALHTPARASQCAQDLSLVYNSLPEQPRDWPLACKQLSDSVREKTADCCEERVGVRPLGNPFLHTETGQDE